MPVTPTQAIQNAYLALQNGDKHSAHHWAAYAAQLAPGLEEAWLMLAACSTPRASIAYLEHALAINPASQRARQGLQWARQRLIVEQRSNRLPVQPQSQGLPVPQPKKNSIWWIGAVLGLMVLTVSVAFLSFGAGLIGAHALQPVVAQIWQAASFGPLKPAPTVALANLASATPLAAPPTLAGAASLDDSVPPLTSTALAGVESAPGQFEEAATQAPLPTATLVFEPPTPTASPAPPTPEPTRLAHIVLPDESAASIAVWYGVEVSALLSFNGLESAEQVQPGLELFIPPVEYVGPPPSYSSEKMILVDISEQHLYAYQGEELIYSFVASTGMGNSTRVGTFEVLDKIPSAYGATWNIWMPNWMGIYWSGHLENGIHALPILPNGATLWEGYLGTPISYGCVVLGTYESQLLYDWAEVGVPVHIQW